MNKPVNRRRFQKGAAPSSGSSSRKGSPKTFKPIKKKLSTPPSIDDVQKLCPFPLEAEQGQQLCQYLDMLMRWNQAINLVGANSWREAFSTLVVDSLYMVEFLSKLPLPEQPETWDLGAGAGLPGIPLRMFWTQGNYYLVEARQKRGLFLATFLAQCPLAGTVSHTGRAEDFFSTRPQADLIISRAFMPWQEVLQLTEPVLKPGGHIVFLVNESLRLAAEDGPWKMVAEQAYAAPRGQRYFCAFRKEA